MVHFGESWAMWKPMIHVSAFFSFLPGGVFNQAEWRRRVRKFLLSRRLLRPPPTPFEEEKMTSHESMKRGRGGYFFDFLWGKWSLRSHRRYRSIPRLDGENWRGIFFIVIPVFWAASLPFLLVPRNKKTAEIALTHSSLVFPSQWLIMAQAAISWLNTKARGKGVVPLRRGNDSQAAKKEEE